MNKEIRDIEETKDKVTILKRIKSKRRESFSFLFDMIDTLFAGK
ncbi:hypothetical protein [Clostridium kluyveri]|nr:hypothetical protein [Clostridium kluyveri]UZQ49711.1 hypothetical protein OP486_17445 [Clostridium kluyveri]